MAIHLNRSWVLWAGVLLLLSVSVPAEAHNGAVALAVPVEGIVVDGDLSDWPEGMKRYAIKIYGDEDQPKDEEDFQGSYRIGYNEQENALYIAVEVQDESVVIDTTEGGEWRSTTQDGCVVYVDVEHKGQDSPAGKYYVIYGNHRRVGRYEVEVERKENQHRYEWRIDIDGMKGKMSLGVDVEVFDTDEDGSFSEIAWGRQGDLVLVEKKAGTGKIQGKIKWEDREEGTALGKVRIQSLTSKELWVQIKLDPHGEYAVELPAGKYRLEAGYRHRKESGNVVEVQASRTVRMDEIYFPRPPLGRALKAGTGRSVAAGAGYRYGFWQTLGMPDGLADNWMHSLLEDRDGQLWIGTYGGGVSRYDGERFVTYTTEDGLAGNKVLSLLEDQDGQLWIGTEASGVSRYDGERFITYTIEDGLAGNWVTSLLEDRDGQLWIGTDGGVSRYDGERFITYTTEDGLPRNHVWSLLEDRDGQLWIGTDGVSRYDGERFVTYTTEDGLPDNNVRSLLEDRTGQLWIGTRDGVSRYDGERFVTYTTKDGLPGYWVECLLEDQTGQLWIGTYGGVSQYDGERFVTYTTEDGLPDNNVQSLLEDQTGQLWIGTRGGLSRYDGERLVIYTTEDGLAGNLVQALLEDRTGRLWFGTYDGLSRYDGERLVTYTTEDGLADNDVRSLLEDRTGQLWIGTRGGLSRYDGERFITYTTEDGLADNWATSLLEDRDGQLWIGTEGGGISRYDGEHFVTYTTEDGLADNWVTSLLEDRDGQLWIGTGNGMKTAGGGITISSSGDGVSRYDGERFVTYTTEDGLPGNWVECLLEDRTGQLWIGTWRGGVSRYDGERFVTYTTEDGLADNTVYALLEDRDGQLWIGTIGGVSRYDGERFVTYTTKDGLAGNWVECLLEDRTGQLWIGAHGGVSRWDGFVFQTLLRRDGLINNKIQRIFQDRQDDIWIATWKGLVRYRPPRTSPPVHIRKVIADRDYGSVEEIRVPSSQKFITFEFLGISYRTRANQMVYVYQLEGYDANWRQTRERRVSYTDLPWREYVFQVKAVDRDLNYSEKPAQVFVTVHPPYGQLGLIGGLGVSLMVLVAVSGYALKKRRDLFVEMEEELRTAHDLQMGLMPTEPPQIEGLDTAGRCLPANHVGGDFFQYFAQNGKLAVCLADVTGHAMEAAVPVMMFSGVLETEMRHSRSLEQLFASLNSTLTGKLPGRTFVCFTMGEIELSTHSLHLANGGGCPSPYHYRASTGEMIELEVVAYPLGVRADTRYSTIETQLEPGDYVVFCSDGITEMNDPSGEIFGFERTTETIRQACAEDLSAEALIDQLIGTVKEFAGGASQGDDMTVVVLKVKA